MIFLKIFYSEQQRKELARQMAFFKTVRILTGAVFFVFLLAFIGGCSLIYFSFPLIGTIVLVLSVLPLIFSGFYWRIGCSFAKLIKKEEYQVFRVKCSSVKRILGAPLWLKVTVKDIDEMELFYYSGDPVPNIKPGTEFDVIIHSEKNYLKFGVASDLCGPAD